MSEGGRGEPGRAPEMDTTVSRDELRRIAHLARLRPEEGEVDRLVRDLNTILDHVAALERVGVEEEPGEAEGAGSEGAFRDPTLPPDPLAHEVPDLAPDWREGFFVVPQLPAVDADGEETS